MLIARTVALLSMFTVLGLVSSCVRAETPVAAPDAKQPVPTQSDASLDKPSSEQVAESVRAEAKAEQEKYEYSSEPQDKVKPAPVEGEQLDAKTSEQTTEPAVTRVAQAAPPKNAPTKNPPQPAAETSAQQPAGSEQAAPNRAPTREEILHSPQWRRAMFEFSEWLSAQTIYTPAQVEQMKSQFNHRVAAMDAAEVNNLLEDMEEKFQIMSTPEAREARAWMAQYLSVMSNSKREQVLKDVPNIATMTAAQLSAELTRIEQTRQQMDSQQEAFQRGQAAQVANQVQTDRTSQQNFVRSWNTAPATMSPYRSSNVNSRLNDTPIGSDMGLYMSPWGGVGMRLW